MRGRREQGPGRERYYKYRGYSDFGAHAAAKGIHYVACLGDFSRTPCASSGNVHPFPSFPRFEPREEGNTSEYVNVNNGVRAADIFS